MLERAVEGPPVRADAQIRAHVKTGGKKTWAPTLYHAVDRPTCGASTGEQCRTVRPRWHDRVAYGTNIVHDARRRAAEARLCASCRALVGS